MRHPLARLRGNVQIRSAQASSSLVPLVARLVGWPRAHRSQRARREWRHLTFPLRFHHTTPRLELKRQRAQQAPPQARRRTPERSLKSSVRPCSHERRRRSSPCPCLPAAVVHLRLRYQARLRQCLNHQVRRWRPLHLLRRVLQKVRPHLPQPDEVRPPPLPLPSRVLQEQDRQRHLLPLHDAWQRFPLLPMWSLLAALGRRLRLRQLPPRAQQQRRRARRRLRLSHRKGCLGRRSPAPHRQRQKVAALLRRGVHPPWPPLRRQHTSLLPPLSQSRAAHHHLLTHSHRRRGQLSRARPRCRCPVAALLWSCRLPPWPPRR